MSSKLRLKRFAVYGVVALFCLFTSAPFLVMLINAFKEDRDLYRPRQLPSTVMIAVEAGEAYDFVIQRKDLKFFDKVTGLRIEPQPL